VCVCVCLSLSLLLLHKSNLVLVLHRSNVRDPFSLQAPIFWFWEVKNIVKENCRLLHILIFLSSNFFNNLRNELSTLRMFTAVPGFFFFFSGAFFLFLQCSRFFLSTGSHLHKQPTCKLAYVAGAEDYKFVTELNLGAQIK
jgi:hypothetical protein